MNTSSCATAPFFYGFSSRSGCFRSQLTWSPSATLVPRRCRPQTWFSIVIDGNSIHIFQALDGLWTTYVFQGPPTVTMGTYCALIDDGFHVYGGERILRHSGQCCRIAVSPWWRAYGNSGIATSRRHGLRIQRVHQHLGNRSRSPAIPR